MVRLIVFLLTLALLGACTSTPRVSDEQRLQVHRAHAGDPVPSIYYSRNVNWSPLGDSAIALWTRSSEAFLLELGFCPELRTTSIIVIRRTGSRLTAGFDSITVYDHLSHIARPHCRIRSIHPLDVVALRRDLAELRDTGELREVHTDDSGNEKTMSDTTLEGSHWQVTRIGGQATLDNARPSLHFDGERLSGTTSCNRYFGSYTSQGSSLSVGMLGASKMGCETERMTQERRFLDALAAAVQWQLNAAGELELSGADGLLLLARRASEDDTHSI